MNSGLLPALLLGPALLLSSCHDKDCPPSAPPLSAGALVRIEVTPAGPTVPLGDQQQFTATGFYEDGSQGDLTATATWTSSVPAVATISDAGATKGLASSASLGTTEISASQDSQTASTTLTVVAAALRAIEVVPENPTAPAGTQLDFKAIGHYSDFTTQDVTDRSAWSSSEGAVASVANELPLKGRANALAAGGTTISAVLESVTGATGLTVTEPVIVSIAVSPTNPSIAAGTTLAFKATATLDNETTRDVTAESTWSSSEVTIATIGDAGADKGKATGIRPGTSTIRAALGGLDDSTTLTVTIAELRSIAVEPVNPSIVVATQIAFKATGTFTDSSTQDLTAQAKWTSSNTAVATISDQAGSKGRATGLVAGTTTITAEQGTISGSTTLTVRTALLQTLTVTPVNPSRVVGTELDFLATGRFEDDSTQDLTAQVTWRSSDATVATVSDQAGTKGHAKALKVGNTTISAELGGLSDSTTLTVTPASLVRIEVTPDRPTIALGTQQAFQATGFFDNSTTQDLTQQAVWDSSEKGVATISNAAGSRGVATSVSTGATDISATFQGMTGSTVLTVGPRALVSIEVIPAEAATTVGNTRAFTATGHYSDQTTQDLTTQATWDSTNQAVAQVSNASGTQGVATALSPGRTTITATRESKTGSATLDVTQAQLLSITVTPENPSIPAAATLNFIATGHYDNNLSQEITNLATWDSGNQEVAVVSNAAGSKGLATAVAQGNTTISATSEGKVGSTVLTVTPPGAIFVRCDSNQDGRNDIADGVRIVEHLFHGRAMPCHESADCNDDGRLSLGDALYCFDFQLREGPVYPPPFPACGSDPSDDTLTCESYSRCP